MPCSLGGEPSTLLPVVGVAEPLAPFPAIGIIPTDAASPEASSYHGNAIQLKIVPGQNIAIGGRRDPSHADRALMGKHEQDQCLPAAIPRFASLPRASRAKLRLEPVIPGGRSTAPEAELTPGINLLTERLNRSRNIYGHSNRD